METIQTSGHLGESYNRYRSREVAVSGQGNCVKETLVLIDPRSDPYSDLTLILILILVLILILFLVLILTLILTDYIIATTRLYNTTYH